MDISAVVFDFGNVLKSPPDPAGFEELQRIAGMTDQPFLGAYWQFRDDYDLGSLDGCAFWQAVAATAGRKLTAGQVKELIVRDADLWMGVDPVLLRWVRALRRQGLKTAVLSNMPREVSAHLRRTGEWQGNFDALVFSGDAGMAKPQPEIYHLCLRALGVQPHEALFIDDREANVEGAVAIGMHGVRFHSVEQLVSDVQPFGLGMSLREAMVAG